MHRPLWFDGDHDSTTLKCCLGVEVLVLLTLAVADGSRLSLAPFRVNLIPSVVLFLKLQGLTERAIDAYSCGVVTRPFFQSFD